MTDPWPERPIHQQLGEHMGQASRAEVLAQLRSGMSHGIIVELEMPDGASLLRIIGTLTTPSRQPPENPEEFAITTTREEAVGWADLPDFTDDFRFTMGLPPVSPPMVRWFRVPDTVIDVYQGGYLLHLGGGVKLAVVLWGMPKPEGWQPEQESSP